MDSTQVLSHSRYVRILAHVVLALNASLVLGCLPSGNAPTGEHIVRDRTLTNAFFVPSEVEGVPSRLLASGPSRVPRAQDQLKDSMWEDSKLVDVYAFPTEKRPVAAEGLAGSEPIIKNLVVEDGYVRSYRLLSDRRGRPIYSIYDEGKEPKLDTIVLMRFDWLPGVATSLGPANWQLRPKGFLASPGRARLLTYRLNELEGNVANHPCGIQQGTFVDEDFYSTRGPLPVSPQVNWIERCKTGADAETLLASTHPIVFDPIRSDRPLQLLIALEQPGYGSHLNGTVRSYVLLDTESHVMTPLPLARGDPYFLSASSSGHWLLFNYEAKRPPEDPTEFDGFFLYNWTNGQAFSIGTSIYGVPHFWQHAWRPGRDELWFEYIGEMDLFGTWSPDTGVQVHEGRLESVRKYPTEEWARFTNDGRYYFQFDRTAAGTYMSVGKADDPSLPSFPLYPAALIIHPLRETHDGRLLAAVSATASARHEVFLVDPDRRTSRLILSGGFIVEVGHTRVLAFLNVVSANLTGSLALIDLETGAQTILAEDVVAATVDPGTTADVPADADRLRPGTQVAYLTRNRMESPYDGLWVATLP